MFKYNCLNPIAQVGLDYFDNKYEKVEDYKTADAVLVRSASMHGLELHDELLAIARAGAGVNNIPTDDCTEKGIVVFNTPGANANGVKELVIAGMLLASRDFVGGISWVKENKDEADIHVLAEKAKKAFGGGEINNKKLGIIGLGAIGVRVANAATSLGMEVYGYDPYISVSAAWSLSRAIKHSKTVEEIYQECDFITIHVPLLDATREMINKDAISMMKKDVVVLNFARDLLVNEEDMVEALKCGNVRKYVTDFPNSTVAGVDGAIVIPHLGASTEESELNCAKMAVKEIKDYLENGNINNSVNFPGCNMGVCTDVARIIIFHKNVKNMISQFSTVLADADINICNMTNKSKGDAAYSIFDLDQPVTEVVINAIKEIEGVLRIRVVK